MKYFSITYIFKEEGVEFQLCRSFVAEDMKEALRQFWHKRIYSYDDDSRRINHKEKYKIISVVEVFSKDLNISTSPEFNTNNDSNVYYDYYNSGFTGYYNSSADNGYINHLATTAQQNLVVGGST